MPAQRYPLEPLRAQDMDAAVDLIARAMNPAEGRWAERTLARHFAGLAHGIDDGRSYFAWRAAESITGLTGLHHYLWGPEHTVWLAWFAVAPRLQRQGHGSALLAAVEAIAAARGYRRLLVETYDHADFAGARAFYQARGFTRAGGIADYLEDGADMVVFGKSLDRG